MIDVKCVVVNKVHRGQDFERLYCSQCPHREGATIEVRDNINFWDGLGKEVKITCPNLKFYQSFRPKKKEDTSMVGKSTTITYGITYRKSGQRSEAER